jgi:hypothetical protein
MAGEDVYELYIDAFKPQTIPMARLAEYMAAFAELLGHREHVHFKGLKAGSLSVAAAVDEIAQPKVDRQIEEVRYSEGSSRARKAFRAIDDKLAEDNAVGRIIRGNTNLIEFPGKTRAVDKKIGPVEQMGVLDGEVIQIGGRDETINIHIKSGDQIHFCVTSEAIARRLAPYIFGVTIRVRGNSTWARQESGGWILKRFEITDFEVLDETPLTHLFAGLRERLIPPEGGRMNPVDLMRQLRDQ